MTCVVLHLDDKPRPATHRAWTELEPDDVIDVCASCAKGLVALHWVAQPSLLSLTAGAKEGKG